MNRTFAYQADLADHRAAEARADAADLRRRADELDEEAGRYEAAARALRAQPGAAPAVHDQLRTEAGT